MTDIIEPRGPQGATIQTADRRPWKVPRLLDLDDGNAMGCDAMNKVHMGGAEGGGNTPCNTYSQSYAGSPVVS